MQHAKLSIDPHTFYEVHCSSSHQIACFMATEWLHPLYRAALSQQHGVASFAALRVASCLHSPGLHCSCCNIVRFYCDLETCNFVAAIIGQVSSAIKTQQPLWDSKTVAYVLCIAKHLFQLQLVKTTLSYLLFCLHDWGHYLEAVIWFSDLTFTRKLIFPCLRWILRIIFHLVMTNSEKYCW
jgi:hypothetical protein